MFWFFRVVRGGLFWLYVWQLKEYHLGRFLDYFATERGRRGLFHPIQLAKLVLASAFFLAPEFAFSLFLLSVLLYGVEFAKAIRDALKGVLVMPVWTKKTLVLLVLIVAVVFFYFWVWSWVSKSVFLAFPYLLLFDGAIPAIVSGIVLFAQPIAVWHRATVIKRAQAKREQLPALKVIGITGSYGKTSTKEFVSAILKKRFRVAKTKEHQNSEIGVARALLYDVSAQDEVFVCEMGAYNRNGIAYLSDIVRPQIAVLTGANEQHLSLFGSMENLMSAEGGEELVQAIPERASVIVNFGSEKLREYLPKYKKTYVRKYVLCSADRTHDETKENWAQEQSDLWAEDVRIEKERVSFRVVTKEGERAEITANLIGSHNVENLLLAIAAAKEMGMALEEIASAISEFTPQMGTMQLRKGTQGLNVIDSTYSANPDGVLSGLDYLKIWEGKKAIVLPSLIELGSAAKEAHERIGEKIAEVCDLAIVTTEDNFDDVKRGALKRGMAPQNILLIEDAKRVIGEIASRMQEGDVVLLAGGRSTPSIISAIIG